MPRRFSDRLAVLAAWLSGIVLIGVVASMATWLAYNGLKNVSLRHASITDVDESFGRFDYIIAHGVFSWIPTTVREKLLDICGKNMAPGGVAYVSYNTYPGWHARGLWRGGTGDAHQSTSVRPVRCRKTSSRVLRRTSTLAGLSARSCTAATAASPSVT